MQVVIGGTNINSEISRMRSGAPDILVATPGRCLDHMTHEGSNLQVWAWCGGQHANNIEVAHMHAKSCVCRNCVRYRAEALAPEDQG